MPSEKLGWMYASGLPKLERPRVCVPLTPPAGVVRHRDGAANHDTGAKVLSRWGLLPRNTRLPKVGRCCVFGVWAQGLWWDAAERGTVVRPGILWKTRDHLKPQLPSASGSQCSPASLGRLTSRGLGDTRLVEAAYCRPSSRLTIWYQMIDTCHGIKPEVIAAVRW